MNTSAVVIGSAIGLTAGTHLPSGIKIILMQALGLATTVIGLRMALEAQHVLLAIGCLLLGGVSGEPVSYTHLDVYKRQAPRCC